jgi:hypothetical protein
MLWTAVSISFPQLIQEVRDLSCHIKEIYALMRIKLCLRNSFLLQRYA